MKTILYVTLLMNGLLLENKKTGKEPAFLSGDTPMTLLNTTTAYKI